MSKVTKKIQENLDSSPAPKRKGQGKGGGRKFTPTDREAVLNEVARLDRKGLSQRQIAERVKVAQPTVCEYLSEIRQRYRTNTNDIRAEMVGEEEAHLRDLFAMAMEAWETSGQALNEDGTPDETTRKAGDVAFLRVMLEIRKSRRELHGLDAPTKTQTQSTNLTIPWDSLTDLRQPPKDVDVIEQKLAKAMPALPAPIPPVNGTNGTHSGQAEGAPP